MSDEDWQVPLFVDFASSNKIKYLAERQRNIPWDAEDDSRETIIDSKWVQCPIFCVKGKSSSLLANKLPSLLFLLFGSRYLGVAILAASRCGN